MARSLAIIACGIVIGLAITWLVMSQIPDKDQLRVQPGNTAYGGARPIPEPR